MQLSEHFGKLTCKTLKKELGLETVEAAQQLNDIQFRNLRGIGSMFIYKLRSIEVQGIIPTRQFCAICGKIHKVNYWVPNKMWNAVIHPNYQNSIVCLFCFMERGDEKFLEWERDITLEPCSFYTQRQIQIIPSVKFTAS